MRPSRRHLARLASAALTAGVIVGCGGGKPPVDTSTEEGTVTGSVRIHGKAPKSGKVIFDPSNHLRRETSRETEIGADGTYSITTLVGQNIVRLETPETTGDRVLSDFDLYYDVKPGENRYDIEMPPPD
jgi:hypothetical protein